jgi:hypothetical protein
MIEAVYKDRLTPVTNLITMSVVLFLFLVYSYLIISLGTDTTGMTQLIILMVIQLTPPLLVLSRRQFNFIVFIMMNHFITYSLAKYNQLFNLEKVTFASPQAIHAFQEMIYCTILIQASYYAARYLLSRSVPLKQSFAMFKVSRELYLTVASVIVFQPLILSFLPPEVSTLYLVASYLSLIFIFCSETESPVFERSMKFVVVLTGCYFFLIFGSLGFFGSVGMLLLIVSFIQWKFKNFVFLVGLATFGMAVQSVKAEFRTISRSADMSILELAGTLNELLVWKFVQGGAVPGILQEANEDDDEFVAPLDPDSTEGEVGDTLAHGFSRIGDDSLERVLAMTPSRVPFWNGETYEHIPYIFIPRIIWPDKPRREIWNKFGRVYGFLSSEDEETSVGINMLGEAYMNYGYAGLYMVSCFFGFLVAFMESLSFLFLPRNTYFAFIAFLTPMMAYGLDLGSILNGVVITLCMLFAVRYRLKRLVQQDVYV